MVFLKIIQKFQIAIILLIAPFLYFNCSYDIRLKGNQETITTVDGWDLTLEHFVPKNGITKKYPVILCHGLAASRFYFKLNEEKSPVALLLEEGYEVFLLDLRGRVTAGSPGFIFGEKTYTYSFDDYVIYDVDKAISEVIKRSGKDKVNWIGHSMGGMVAYARMGSYNENRIANLVTIGSPFAFLETSSTFKTLNSMSFLTHIIPAIPARRMARIKAGIRLPILPDGRITNMIYWEENIEPKILRGLHLTTVNDIAIPEILQFSKWVDQGSVMSRDGKINYTENLSKISTPVLLVWGTRDNLAPGSVVRHVYERIGSQDKSVHIVGRSQGHSEDYGHTDLIIGKKSGEEVFLPTVKWLNDRN